MGPEAVPPVPPAHGWSNLQLKRDIAITSKWPVQVQGSLCWEPAVMGGGEQCILTLNGNEIDEVRSAVRFFNGWSFSRSAAPFVLSPLTWLGRGLYGSDVSPSTFPLPTLGPRLLKLALAVHSGRGFALVRGLNPDDFSQEDNVVVFLGISSYIGPKRGRQDEEGNMLSESTLSLHHLILSHMLTESKCTSGTPSSPGHGRKTGPSDTRREHL